MLLYGTHNGSNVNIWPIYVCDMQYIYSLKGNIYFGVGNINFGLSNIFLEIGNIFFGMGNIFLIWAI